MQQNDWWHRELIIAVRGRQQQYGSGGQVIDDDWSFSNRKWRQAPDSYSSFNGLNCGDASFQAIESNLFQQKEVCWKKVWLEFSYKSTKIARFKMHNYSCYFSFVFKNLVSFIQVVNPIFLRNLYVFHFLFLYLLFFLYQKATYSRHSIKCILRQ